jgi:hypothetical protein
MSPGSAVMLFATDRVMVLAAKRRPGSFRINIDMVWQMPGHLSH